MGHLTCVSNIKLLFITIFVVFVVTILLVTANFNNDYPKMTISDGKLKGFIMQTTSGREVEAYLGIPYASPPIGELRFKAAVDPTPWSNEMDATKDPAPCTQLSTDADGNQIVIGQEDCLKINVFRPKNIKNHDQLPVLVYIHGGGLYMLSSTIKDYGPEILLNEDIILVTMNYRLDILGFLSTEDKFAPGNNGFKDQVAALKWVKNNIKYFGGNPEKVTIYGHSAGGYSVHYHLLSPLSKGLFVKGISGSGNVYMIYPYEQGLVADRTRQLGEYVECPTFNEEILIKCLQYTPVDKLFKELYKFRIWGNEPKLIFGPVIESNSSDAFITKESMEYNNITTPWITGMVSQEGLLSTAGLSQNAYLLDELDKKFNILSPMTLRYYYNEYKYWITRTIRNFYFGDNEITREKIPELTNTYTDALQLYGILKSISKHKGPVYVYYFTHRGLYSGTDGITNKSDPGIQDDVMNFIRNGVSHGDELQYIFPSFKSFSNRKNLKFNKDDQIISTQFSTLLIDFIVHEEPSYINWKKSSLENLEYLHIGTNEFKMKDRLLAERSNFWKQWIFSNVNKFIKEEL